MTFTWQTTALCFLWCFSYFPKLEDFFLSLFLYYIVIFVKVKDDLERHSRELVDLASDLDVDVSTSNMQSWASEVREHAKSISFFHAICLIFYCLSCLYQSLLKLVNVHTCIVFWLLLFGKNRTWQEMCVRDRQQWTEVLRLTAENWVLFIFYQSETRNFNRLAGWFVQSFTLVSLLLVWLATVVVHTKLHYNMYLYGQFSLLLEKRFDWKFWQHIAKSTLSVHGLMCVGR